MVAAAAVVAVVGEGVSHSTFFFDYLAFVNLIQSRGSSSSCSSSSSCCSVDVEEIIQVKNMTVIIG